MKSRLAGRAALNTCTRMRPQCASGAAVIQRLQLRAARVMAEIAEKEEGKSVARLSRRDDPAALFAACRLELDSAWNFQQAVPISTVSVLSLT